MDSDSSNQSHWIPLADLMTGLMMIFMLLTAAFMLRVEQTTTLIIKEYEETKRDMKLALQQEFRKDLKQWNAEILGDMTIRFNDPQVLFDTGSADLKPQFRDVLKQFFPRYVGLLSSPMFRESIREVRIEGHTSAFWSGVADTRSAYFKNMELSQARTRSTLQYVLSLADVQDNSDWLVRVFTANGLSSSRPMQSVDDRNATAHQRVEFRIVTNAEDRMERIFNNVTRDTK